MIEAIPNFNTAKLNIKSSSKQNHNYFTSNLPGINLLADEFTNSNKNSQITFKGNFSKLGTKIIGDRSKKFGGKFKSLAEEISDTAYKMFIKIKRRDKFPIIKKPIVAYYDSVDTNILTTAEKLLNDPNISAADKMNIQRAIKHAEQYGKGSDGSYTYTSDGIIRKANQTAMSNAKKTTPDFTGNSDDLGVDTNGNDAFDVLSTKSALSDSIAPDDFVSAVSAKNDIADAATETHDVISSVADVKMSAVDSLDAMSTKTALADSLSIKGDAFAAFDTKSSIVDLLATKASAMDIAATAVDSKATVADVLTAKIDALDTITTAIDHKSVIADIIDIIEKIF